MTDTPDPKAQLIERIRRILIEFDNTAASTDTEHLARFQVAEVAIASAWIEDVEIKLQEQVVAHLEMQLENLSVKHALRKLPIEYVKDERFRLEAGLKGAKERLHTLTNKSKEQA